MIDQAAIAALVLAHPVAFAVTSVVVIGGAIATCAEPQQPKTRRLRFERTPVGRIKPIKPVATRPCGPARNLIERQRAWIEAESTQQQAPSAGVSKEAGEAFADWFNERIVIPTTPTLTDVIPQDNWESDYTQYCDKRGVERLFGEDLFDHMDSYTRHYNCILGSKGEINGAYLKV
jgi:hypothetical protein